MVTPKSGRLATLALERSPWRSARWLVIAPHADDETLGAGALIRQAAETGRLAGVVVLTDGAGSHEGVVARVGLHRQIGAEEANTGYN
ncbi:PIG-L family deacetylase, partial [Brevundimonas sp.]|uniref:PIG-L deacetylase family protein n=1 Tax=Brevundimonas sp. TaxID=1871086 RepID=UPI002899279B